MLVNTLGMLMKGYLSLSDSVARTDVGTAALQLHLKLSITYRGEFMCAWMCTSRLLIMFFWSVSCVCKHHML